jgi:hypothetical protein
MKHEAIHMPRPCSQLPAKVASGSSESIIAVATIIKRKYREAGRGKEDGIASLEVLSRE